MMNDFKQACENMTELIISCWDENNPNDGLTFDERLAAKTANLKEKDKQLMKQILGGT